jgi:hypothetical protein
MSREEAVTAAVILGVAALGAAAQRAARGVGTATPDAVAWHGAMSMYSRIATWAGRKALAAEAEYWKAVRS